MILGNFISSALEAQYNPEELSTLNTFATIDIVFTVD